MLQMISAALTGRCTPLPHTDGGRQDTPSSRPLAAESERAPAPSPASDDTGDGPRAGAPAASAPLRPGAPTRRCQWPCRVDRQPECRPCHWAVPGPGRHCTACERRFVVAKWDRVASVVQVQVRIAGAIKVELHLRFERHAHVILVAASPLRLIGDFESIDRLPNKAAALTRNRSVGVAVSGKLEASKRET
jgi:hypothetical protein